MSFIVVTHTDPLSLRLRLIEHEGTPDGQAAVAYLHGDHVVARGVITEDALPALRSLLESPVNLALAVKADAAGNIDGRICLVLPIGEGPGGEDGDADGPAEPWKDSVPAPSFEKEEAEPDPRGSLALLPIGNVVRSAAHRKHADLSADAREMLVNLLSGGGRDAVSRAIDDLLGSL